MDDLDYDIGNEFPFFQDADVVITISAASHYKLHASILRRSSSWFRRVLAKDRAAKLCKRAIRRAITTQYRLTLTTGPEDDGFQLVPLSVDEDGKAVEKIAPLGRTYINGLPVPAWQVAWDMVFGAFYNREIDVAEFEEINGTEDNPKSLANAAKLLVDVAVYLNCVQLMTKPIEATLLAAGQKLHKQIASDPGEYLHFSSRLKSKVLFREALIHSAGQFNSKQIQDMLQRNIFEPEVADLLIAKATMLVTASRKSVATIITHYPFEMRRERGLNRADREATGRNSYANDILSWIGLTAFRQWISQMVNNDKTHRAEDMGFRFFKLIALENDAYLTRDSLTDFHLLFPMSWRALAVVESKISGLKTFARTIAQPLMVNRSGLDETRFPVGHFTFTIVNEEDYPWIRVAPAEPSSDEEMDFAEEAEDDGRGGEEIDLGTSFKAR